MVTLKIFNYTGCLFAVTVAERSVHVSVLLWGTTDQEPHLPTQQIVVQFLWHADLQGVRLVAFMVNEVTFNATDVAAPETKMSRYSR